MPDTQLTEGPVQRTRRLQPPTPVALPRRPMMDARRLIVHSVRPLNAETPLEELSSCAITRTELFFVRSHGAIPQPDVRTFRLAVGGEVRSALVLGLRELGARFARATVTATLACAGNRRTELRPVPPGVPWGPGAIGTARWSGVRLREVLLAAGLGPQARHVAFTGLDDAGGERFAGSIPIEKALAAEVLLADEMNGAPLPAEHGFPLRAVVPGYIGARSVKWLSGIEVLPEPSASAFQRRDYALHGSPLGAQPVTSAMCRPADGAFGGPRLRVEGYACGAGGNAVIGVEVSADAGHTWSPAMLHGRPQAWAWRLWHADLNLVPGIRELMVRATDTSGVTQPRRVDPTGNPHGYGNNGWHRITVVTVPEPGEAAGGPR